jgi:hypothetical protein
MSRACEKITQSQVLNVQLYKIGLDSDEARKFEDYFNQTTLSSEQILRLRHLIDRVSEESRKAGFAEAIASVRREIDKLTPSGTGPQSTGI